MAARIEPKTAQALVARLRTLRARRRRQHDKSAEERRRRAALTPAQRTRILSKTDGRCHLCGGRIADDWHADHVLSHSGGGQHAEDNYLPAHKLCNNYRWDYVPEEFQWILKVGVWAVNEIQKENPSAVGQDVAKGFIAKEQQRRRRRIRV
jgi:5-methylcytosine-specific restriction endonuclease McrA